MQKRATQDNRFIRPVTTTKADNYALDFSLNDVKGYLLVTHNEDDTTIQKIIEAVVSKLEQVTKRPFSYTRVTALMEVCQNPLFIPRLPVINMDYVGIKVDRGYNGYEALTTDEYEILGDELLLERLGVILFQYTAGYAPGELPSELKLAAFAEIAYRYENRGDKEISNDLCATAIKYIENYIVTSYL